jgi:serine phosphatase RsbU (regulator of sigma subunit)
VSKYDGKSFTHYTDKEGLSNNTVLSILEDKSGNLWLGKEKGLNCFVVGGGGLFSTKLHNGEEKYNPQIVVFHKDDGLKAEDFFQNAVLLDSKNKIWWGSGKALSMLDLNEFQLNEKEPEIQLENIYLQENFVDYRSIKTEIKDSLITNENEELKNIKFTGVADFYNYPKDLELPYYLNHLTFNFSAIDWYAPHKIKYQYKLEGLDIDWSNLTSENKADYRNIPFGNYTFKVKAIGSANKWSKTFEYDFTIHPPWWRTWWAYAIYVLLIVTVIVLIVRWNGRRLRERAKELAYEVKIATAEIRQQKEVVEEQKAVVEHQKEIVEGQKHLLEEKQKEILDSINYAKRIQYTLLAHDQFLKDNLNEHFTFFNPKDIVSGDFYWATKIVSSSGVENFYLAVCNSTGHGVPGAFMSLLNIGFLSEAINEKGIEQPNEVLNYVRERLTASISKDGQKDGFDGILVCFSKDKITYAAANNAPVLVRKKTDTEPEFIELKSDRMPVGVGERKEPFNLYTIDYQKGDMLYLYTDGYADQFGGPKGKKFKYKPLNEMLVANTHLSLPEQHKLLKSTFDNWKGDLEQVDDVCVIGVRV